MTSVRQLTEILASIPSHESERELGDVIEVWLREHTDATVSRDDAGNDENRGGNVFARKGSGDSSLAFVGHHDVVAPDDSQLDDDGEYVIEQRDGRLYGRGTADMAGSLAAAMCAFRDADPVGELVFASFVGEEAGGVGAQHAIEETEDGPTFAPDYAIVGEGSTGYSTEGVTDVVVAHKGRRGSTITATGTAAHASEPEAGDNAIYRATDAIDRVRNMSAPETTVLGHELTGSLAITEIEGGSGWNVIPDRCEMTVDERTVPDERAALDRVAAIPDVEWTVEQDLPPMACGDPNFADTVLAAATESQSGMPEQVVKPHATDAGWLAQAGTACVVCGAAEPGEAHTATESVSLDVVERCYEIYRRVAEIAVSLRV